MSAWGTSRCSSGSQRTDRGAGAGLQRFYPEEERKKQENARNLSDMSDASFKYFKNPHAKEVPEPDTSWQDTHDTGNPAQLVSDMAALEVEQDKRDMLAAYRKMGFVPTLDAGKDVSGNDVNATRAAALAFKEEMKAKEKLRREKLEEEAAVREKNRRRSWWQKMTGTGKVTTSTSSKENSKGNNNYYHTDEFPPPLRISDLENMPKEKLKEFALSVPLRDILQSLERGGDISLPAKFAQQTRIQTRDEWKYKDQYDRQVYYQEQMRRAAEQQKAMEAQMAKNAR